MFDVKNMKEYHKLFDEAPIAFTIIEVLRGETDEAILKASDVQPKYVLRDVAELAQILRSGTAV